MTETTNDVSSENISSEVRDEQIRLLYRQGVPIQLLGVVTALIAVAMFREVVDPEMLWLWFGGMVVVTFVRLFLNYRFSMLPLEQKGLALWGNLYVLGTFVSGVIWGILAFFYDASWPVSHQIVLFVIYTGVTAGAFNTNSPVFIAFPAFYLPPILCLMFVMLRAGEAFYELVGLFLIYALLMAVSSKRYYQRLKRLLHLQIINESLTRDLENTNRRLIQLTELDDLTKLYNRRTMDRFMGDEWNRHLRSNKPLSLLYLDIDYFKQYNDTYGHYEGDRCLIRVAGVLKQHAQRSTDMAARFGGEEFAVILPETDQEEANGIAESIRASIEALQIPHGGSKISGVLTSSIGVATTMPEPDTLFDTLKIDADTALYQAKEQGRNCVVSA